jgi:transposase InsO family protein
VVFRNSNVSLDAAGLSAMVDIAERTASIDGLMVGSTTLLQFLLMLVAGWLQRQQVATIDYLKAENRMLRERLGGRRIIFTDAERRQLAEKARALGRMALRELGTIVTPETLLRWHRELVAQKWSFVERRRPGRPRTREELAPLVVRMATENRTWGYTRIQGAMANLGHKLGRGTIRRILKDHGIEPAPERGKGMPWSVFLKAHWKALAASDFFTVEVWSWSGLVTYYVLLVMELATRRVCIAGITTHPDTQWMLQMARQLTDTVDGILLGKRYLILDRDTNYCQALRDFLKREGIEVIRLRPRSPNLNAYAERWVRSVRDECLSRLIPIGQGMLRRALREYGAHFHQERNHQGLGNVLIMPRASSAHREAPLVRRPRFGGLLNHYERAAA